MGVITALIPRYRRLVPCRIDDLEAMDRLGVRLDIYSDVTVPTATDSGSHRHGDCGYRHTASDPNAP